MSDSPKPFPVTDGDMENFYKDFVGKVPEKIRDVYWPETVDAQAGISLTSADATKENTVRGYDFNTGLDLDRLLASYSTVGSQSSNFAKAVNIMNNMIDWRLSDEDVSKEQDERYKDPEIRKDTRCTIFMGYSASLVSCGMREVIR